MPKAIIGPVPGAHQLQEGIGEGWITAPKAGPSRRCGCGARVAACASKTHWPRTVGSDLYVHTTALLKRHVGEDDSGACERLLLADPSWVTARHTWVEVLRNLGRLLSGANRTSLAP